MKKLLQIILTLVAVVILTITIPQFILAYPNFLFEERHAYKNFAILSDRKFDADLDVKLDSISFKLESTGFYNQQRKIKVVFFHGDKLTSFLDKISLAPSGAGFHHFTGNIYIFNSRIEKFQEENSKAKGELKKIIAYSYQSFDLEDILLHEILHKLHSDTLGLWEFKRKMPPPHWKAEGFAEYYTYRMRKGKDSIYDFRERVTLYLTYKDQFPLFYFKSQLLYEYLTDYEHLNFHEIMNDNLTEENAYFKLIEWYNPEN